MEWVETTGRTLDEAKEAALDQLGVDETDAEFEILEEPKAGLFGRVRGEARVRARVRPTAPRPKDDRRDRRRRNRGQADSSQTTTPAGVAVVDGDDSTQSEDATRAGSRGGSGRSSAGGRTAGRSRRPGNEQAPSAGDGEEEAAEAPDTSTDAVPGEAGPGGRRRTRRAGGGSNSRGTPGSPGGRPARVSAGSGEAENGHSNNGRADMSVDVPLGEQGQVAEEFLKGLISEFGMEASLRVTASDADQEVRLDLAGSDLGLLIGPKGSTLLAIQDLTRTAVHHKTHAGNGRLLVDVGAYRQKRSEALARFAQEVADRVKESGSPTALEPMAAPDRKVVHDAITGIDGVSTVSEGEEPRRRVVIVPAEPADA